MTPADLVGITSASYRGHVGVHPVDGEPSLFDLPRLMRDELDRRVIDINTSSLESLEPNHLQHLREEADKAGCLFTNLKMNGGGLKLGSPDADEHARALSRTMVYRAQEYGSISAAA